MSPDFSRDTVRAQQPGVDEPPFVAAPRLKIQEPGLCILECVEEFQ